MFDRPKYTVCCNANGRRRRRRRRRRRKRRIRNYIPFSKMDKRAKDKLVRSPRENGGG